VISTLLAIVTDGVAVAIDPAATLQVQFFSPDGLTALGPARNVLVNETPATNWPLGLVGVLYQSQELPTFTPPSVMAVITGPPFDVKRFLVDVVSPTVIERSLLFIKDFAVTQMRNERLVMLAKSYFPGVTLSDDYIWNKVVAAENETGRDLRVPLVPTQFFGFEPTDAQIAALPPGMPWAIDPPQDYSPDFFQGEKWGFMVLRNKPVISVQDVQFIYPSPTVGFFDFPLDWIRLDKKYAQIRFVPASSIITAPLNAYVMQVLGGGRTIPFAFNVTYTAGIGSASEDYPQLLDVILRRAALKILEDGFLPASGSISADGLSQSLSIAMDGYRDTIDATLNGPKGSNGGLMTAIHGVRMASLGN
jgi:hypothetical protein